MRVSWMVLVSPALVAETRMGYVPAGVAAPADVPPPPPPGGTFVGILRPVPQPAAMNVQESKITQASRGSRPRQKAKRPSGRSAASQIALPAGDCGMRSAAWPPTPVCTTTDTVTAFPLSVALDGVTLHAALAGAPVHANVAVVADPDERKRSGKTAFCPLAMVTVVSPSAPRAKSSAVPLSRSVRGEPGALSVTVSVPVRAPAAEGAKTTCSVQAAAGASV